MQILNVEITTASKRKILSQVATAISGHQKFVIFTPNPEIIVAATHDPSFQKLLNTGDVNLADGVGLKIAYFLRHPFSKIPFEIIHGIDFMMELCGEAEKNNWSVGLLGGRDGAAEKTKNMLMKQFPTLKIEYVFGDFLFSVGDGLSTLPMGRVTNPPLRNNENHHGNDQLDLLMPVIHLDILFVALGSPKEQVWIAQNRDVFPATVFMQVGGAFDMLSGLLPRAPRLMRHLGLEWLWRLILQPKRISRQLRLVEFLVRYLFTNF